jgi:hypothetical protein
MSVRVGPPAARTDRPLLAVVALTGVVTTVGLLWLVQAALGGERFDHRTVRVDNRSALPLQVDVVDRGGDRMGLGEAGPRATSTFQEVADPGTPWTFVVSYGGREVMREAIGTRELAGRGWTLQVPATATGELEGQGYR